MPDENKPYFSLSRHSFEKNAGYKTTVHALAELIDNSFEANASNISVVLMIDRDQRLKKIAVVDDGDGMNPQQLQNAVCEKSGSHLDRQLGGGSGSSKKFGKYGVGLPKASISQCNKFSVWSWTSGGYSKASLSSIDIQDDAWINSGAQVPPAEKSKPDVRWLEAAGLDKAKSGSMVLWERLEGVTWQKARWGEQGLIPNFKFYVGRIYRRMLTGNPPKIAISISVIFEESFEIHERFDIKPNDPLYLTPGCEIPREKLADGTMWPPDDPMFDDVTNSLNILTYEVPQSGGRSVEVDVSFRRSVAKKRTAAYLNGVKPGNLLHGGHAGKNAGLSILREGREVDLSQALMTPNKPQERWFGVEFDIPHELDSALGMTNNKQSYTRLEQVLRQEPGDFINKDESSKSCLERLNREDPQLAICLKLAWQMQEVWEGTKKEYENGRTLNVQTEEGSDLDTDDDAISPAGQAEGIATLADKEIDGGAIEATQSEAEKKRLKGAIIKELVGNGVSPRDADEIASRMVRKGLSYVILEKSGLGSSFFNVRGLVDAKVIEINTDHGVYPLLLSSIQDIAGLKTADLQKRIADTQMTILLMLEAWAKIESSEKSADRKKVMRTLREDWGRCLEDFTAQAKR